MPERLVQESYNQLVVKILIPAFIIGSVGVMIEYKNNKSKISMVNSVLSILIGLCGAYICSDFIIAHFAVSYIMIIGGGISLLTEKIVKFIMNEFKIDVFLTTIAEYGFEQLKKFLK